MKNTIFKIILSFSVIVGIICLFNIGKWIYENKKNKDIYNDIMNSTIITEEDGIINNNQDDKVFNEAGKYELVNPPEDVSDSYYNYVQEPFINVAFDELKKKNDEVVGYIDVLGTKIQYPILQTTNNKYYLNHSYDKSYNSVGWVFMDYRNDAYTFGKNTIIYGHSRKDGTMFSSLKNLLNKDYYNDKSKHLIKMSNEKENTIWQVFSVYKIKEESYYITTVFKKDSLFTNFIDTIKNRSIYDFNTYVGNDDNILTLSTCYDNKGTRIVVHARLIKRQVK